MGIDQSTVADGVDQQSISTEDEKLFDELKQEQRLGIETVRYCLELKELLKTKLSGEDWAEVQARLDQIEVCICDLAQKPEDEIQVPIRVMAHNLRGSDRIEK